MTPLRFAVIGVGAWGQRHVATLRAIEAETGLARLVALADPDQARAQRVSEAIGITAYRGYADLLTGEALDAVCLCTPEQDRVAPALACLERGLHLLIEKPLATTVEDAVRLAAAARAAQSTVTVGHILRFLPQYQAAHDAVSGGRLGELVHLFARRNSLATSGERIGGRTTLALFQAIHDLDVLRWLGGPVTRVHAEAASRRLARFGVADTLFATLRFANGAVGAVECSWALPRESPSALDQELEVVGTRGSLRVSLADEGIGMTIEGRHHTPHLSLLGETPAALRSELLGFIDAIRHKTPPAVSADEAAEAVRLAVAVDRSIASGQPVEVA